MCTEVKLFLFDCKGNFRTKILPDEVLSEGQKGDICLCYFVVAFDKFDMIRHLK